MSSTLIDAARRASGCATEVGEFNGEVPPLAFTYRGERLKRNREISAKQAEAFYLRGMPCLIFSFFGHGALSATDAEALIQEELIETDVTPTAENWIFIYGRRRGSADSRVLVFASAQT